MPKALEEALEKEARKRKIKKGSPKWRRFIFGTMRKTGWVPSTQKKKPKKS